MAQNQRDLLLARCKDLELHEVTAPLFLRRGVGDEALDIKDEILARLLDHSQLTIGHEILREALLLIRHQPCEVGLILSIYACHQLDVRTETFALYMPPLCLLGRHLIRQTSVPCPTEIAITPRPLLLAGRIMVGGHMEHAGLRVVFIAALKVEA